LVETDSEEEEEQEETKTSGNKGKEERKEEKMNNGLVDLEDIGSVVQKARKKIKEEKNNGELKEMVTPELRKALTKQGYKLIGSHSGVKLCRWTKVL
jgi:tRNA wybutosine-synthesizing protein 1